MTFADALASWLPAQRWYSGVEAPVRNLSVTAEATLLAGDPGLRHLIVSAPGDDEACRYQVLAGFRSRLPGRLSAAVIGPAADGMIGYDALHDPELAGQLLSGIAGQRSVGGLRFARVPGAAIDDWPDARVLRAEQSNTSVVFGETAILKVLRRPSAGPNPDLEVTAALWRLGSSRVAAPLGWIETRLDGEPALLAVLSQYLPEATDGWTLAVTVLREEYRRAGCDRAGEHGDGRERGGGDQGAAGFADEAGRLGRATAQLHADLAAAFGAGPMTGGALAALAGRMTSGLDQACADVPELRRHAARLRACYASLAQIRGQVTEQRVHGDYHLGQVLRTADGWVALDFEGEPAVPLAQRTARYPVLKDVAGMLRSFDYAARHQLLGHPEATRLHGLARDWVRRCQAAFCSGYAQAGGTDPAANATLLRALMLEKAVYEVRYEARHRPAWMSIPLESIAAA